MGWQEQSVDFDTELRSRPTPSSQLAHLRACRVDRLGGVPASLATPNLEPTPQDH